jgi:lysozyme
MRYWFRCALSVLACGVLLVGAARTDETNLDVSDSPSVSDGPSRKELFLARMAAELGPGALLSASNIPPFVLPPQTSEDSFFGIDVSHYDDENCACKPGQDCSKCKIDWGRAASQKVSFVYAKTTQGTRYLDRTFAFHWRNLAQNGILRGAYHFMSADEDPLVQADYFLEQMEQAGNLTSGDLPPCLDLEADIRKDAAKRWIVDDRGNKRDFWRGQDADDIADKVLTWMKRVEEKTGRTPIIYTSPGWWNDNLKGTKKAAQLQRYHVWVAHYFNSGSPARGKPDIPAGHDWVMWQFTENGKMKDAEVIAATFDVSIVNGTLEQLQSSLGVSVPEKKEIASTDTSTDTNKPTEPVVTANPSDAKDTAKPTEPIVTANPTDTKDTNKPTEPVVAANPSDAKDTITPAEPVVAANPADTKDTNKATEPIVTANPTDTKDTNKPTEPVVTANPADAKDTNKPAEPVVAANPPDEKKATDQVTTLNPGGTNDTGTPSQPPAGSSPNGTTDDGKSSVPTTGVVPNDAKQSTTPSSSQSRPRTRSPRSRTAQSSATQDVAVVNVAPQGVPAQKSMVEIVLANGRTLRVDSNIDPALLSRLIMAVEAN